MKEERAGGLGIMGLLGRECFPDLEVPKNKGLFNRAGNLMNSKNMSSCLEFEKMNGPDDLLGK